MIYTDGDLYFDKDNLRYYLSTDFVSNKIDLKSIGIDDFVPNPSNLPKETIEFSCDMLWDFIEKHSMDYNSSVYYATQNKRVYLKLKKALLLQLYRFLQTGDTDNGVEFKETDRIHKGAVNSLYSTGMFTIIIDDIPENVEEW